MVKATAKEMLMISLYSALNVVLITSVSFKPHENRSTESRKQNWSTVRKINQFSAFKAIQYEHDIRQLSC